MSEEKIKLVEKHYIEVNPSGWHRFWLGVLSGLGWGIGVTLGTTTLIIIIGYLVSQVDWVPIVGNFLQNIVNTAQSQPIRR